MPQVGNQLPLVVGRYELNAELASGGMAVVHLGRLRGDAGFARPVAIKRLHRQYVGDPELNALLLDEARLASRLKHPNIVSPQDLVTRHGEIFVVMEYVHGLTLAALSREARARGEGIPIPIVARVFSDLLSGLHAAHEATDGRGRPLALVHRDISPQNIMVGADGLTRVLDFGIAKAAFRSQTTREGQLRAKLAYAAPEHVLDRSVDRRADVYSSAIVFWESLTLERLFAAGNESALLARVLEGTEQPASKRRPETPPELDVLLRSALSKDPEKRPASAEEFAIALERIVPPATHREVARWVTALGGEALEHLAARVSEVEAGIAVDEMPVAFATVIETRTSEAPVDPSGKGSPRGDPRTARSWKAAATALALALAGALAAVLAISRGKPVPGLGSKATVAATNGIETRETSERSAVNTAGLPTATRAVEPPLLAAHRTPGSTSAARSSALEQRSGAPIQKKTLVPVARPASNLNPPPAAENCSQLTEIDAQGIRRVKRQCLR